MKPDGNILVLTQWSFRDALVQTYTLPYVDMIRKIISPGRKIFLVTAEQQPIAVSRVEAEKLNTEWAPRNMHLVAQPYRRFGIKKLIATAGNLVRLYRLIKKEKIKTIHAFCTPAGSMAYLLSVFTGAALVIDSYEPHAEAMVENGTWKKGGLAYRILFYLEKKQTRRAGALIATTSGMKQYAIEKYGVTVKNFYVKPACVDMEKFFPREKDAQLLKELDIDNKKVCVYAGKLGGIYFKQEVFDFIRSCYDHWKDRFRFLMLTNTARSEIDSAIKRAGLPAGVVISFFVFHDEIPRYLSLGDFAINPVKPVPTKRYCTSIKDGEYWAMGLPVVISPHISDDSEIISQEAIGVVVDLGKKEEHDSVIYRLEELLTAKSELQAKTRSVAEKYRSFQLAENIYKAIYGRDEIKLKAV
jgi:glycosyltransferase involved in cell wall biosynthesis